MNKKYLLSAMVIPAVLAGGAGWWYGHLPAKDRGLTLYGNVDFRQASVPFKETERIAEILVEEGQIVQKGQVLARLETSRFLPQLEQAVAAVEAQKAVVERLRNGSRPEEVAQAQATLLSARADAENARAQYLRRKALVSISAVSQQDVDTTKASADVAAAKVALAQNALDLAMIGPRREDIAQAEAQLRGAEAQAVVLRQQLADAELQAPFDAVVRSRLMEPGEMASPSKPVLSLAMLDRKWVRAYVSEPDLTRLHEGAPAQIALDNAPEPPLSGWVGFISSVAEFTPKAVQTEDLRTSLVYEVRVFVRDPDNRLRLGMPATVRLEKRPPEERRSGDGPRATPETTP